MDKPIDTRREELIAELTRVNDELHLLRLEATKLQRELGAMKSKPSLPSSPPTPKPLASPKKPSAKPKAPKPPAPEDDFLMQGRQRLKRNAFQGSNAEIKVEP
jgi:hypothetical protein